MPDRRTRIIVDIIVAVSVVHAWYMYFAGTPHGEALGLISPVTKTVILLALIAYELKQTNKDDDNKLGM